MYLINHTVTTAPSPDDDDPMIGNWWYYSERVGISTLLGFFSLICIVGNVLVVLAVASKSYLHYPTSYLIVSMAVADLIVGLVVMPISICNYALDGRWPLSLTLCDIWHSLDILASTASIWNLCIISLDRYLAVRDPINYRDTATPRRITLMILCVWVTACLLSFPAIAWWRFASSSDVYADPTACRFTDDVSYIVVSSVVSFYLPLGVTCFAYYRVFLKANLQEKSLRLGRKKINNKTRNNKDRRKSTQDDYMRMHRGGGNSLASATHRGGAGHRGSTTSSQRSNAPSAVSGANHQRVVGGQNYYASIPKQEKEKASSNFEHHEAAPTQNTQIITTSSNDGLETIASTSVISSTISDTPNINKSSKTSTTKNIDKSTKTLTIKIDKSSKTAVIQQQHKRPYPTTPQISISSSCGENVFPICLNLGNPEKQIKSEATIGCCNDASIDNDICQSMAANADVPGAAVGLSRSVSRMSNRSIGSDCSTTAELNSLVLEDALKEADQQDGLISDAKEDVEQQRQRVKTLILRSSAASAKLKATGELTGSTIGMSKSHRQRSTIPKSPSGAALLTLPTSSSGCVGTSSTGGQPQKPSSIRSRKRFNRTQLFVRLIKEKRAAKTLGLVVGCFVLCWLPFFTVNILIVLCPTCLPDPDVTFMIVTWLGYFNSSLNPIIYSTMSREFKRAFREIIFGKKANPAYTARKGLALAIEGSLSVMFLQYAPPLNSNTAGGGAGNSVSKQTAPGGTHNQQRRSAFALHGGIN